MQHVLTNQEEERRKQEELEALRRREEEKRAEEEAAAAAAAIAAALAQQQEEQKRREQEAQRQLEVQRQRQQQQEALRRLQQQQQQQLAQMKVWAQMIKCQKHIKLISTRQKKIFSCLKLPSSSKWGQQSSTTINQAQNALSLAEIQKLEEERERQAREEVGIVSS